MTEQELLKLKKKVEDAQTQVSELKGQLQAQIKQLKDDWGCKTIEEAEKKLKTMDKDLSTLEEQITIGIEELEEKLNTIEG